MFCFQQQKYVLSLRVVGIHDDDDDDGDEDDFDLVTFTFILMESKHRLP